MNLKHFAVTATTVATIFSLAASPMAAFAVDASPTPSPTPSPSTSPSPTPKAGEIRGKREENRVNIAVRHSTQLAKYCTNVETRLNNLITRINTRIAKEKASGKDTSAAETSVTEAQSAITSAQSYCDQAVAKYDSIPADKWSVQHPLFIEARGLARKAHDEFVSARKALASALHALATKK